MTMRAVLALAAAFLALPTSAPFECRDMHTPQQCMRTPACMWWDICFKNAEAYDWAHRNGRVVHCRDVKDELRGVRVIAVSPTTTKQAAALR